MSKHFLVVTGILLSSFGIVCLFWMKYTKLAVFLILWSVLAPALCGEEV